MKDLESFRVMPHFKATLYKALAGISLLFTALPVMTAESKVKGHPETKIKIISYVDRSLDVAQKYLLRVDGKPFYMTNIQVRLDKLRYWWGFDAAAREAVIARAAADGFNTVSIPIHWYEVEPKKDAFDWATLDEYLGLANKYNLKVELLWFGQNSGGHVQWLGDPAKNPVHLRTPDYVLYSPAPRSPATTSDYTVRRDMSDYTLDLADDRLKARETYVLSQVMAHIASWDAANGSKHTIIGVQLGNEVRGIKVQFPASLVISYMSGLGSAVKNSAYVVWTRLNCVYMDVHRNIDANEALRSGKGTNIDFVGIDTYRHHFKSDGLFVASMRTNLPYKGGNYRMIMESAAEVSNAAVLQLAALSGNNAYDHYDMLGPDGHGLYDRSGATGFTPHGAYINDVRVVNKLLNSDVVDIALNAQGYGLFVHNWAGDSTEATTGVEGIAFTPGSATSQAVSISRSNTEIVLMNTKGGTFTFPPSLGINGASRGYFDGNNAWVNEGSVPFTRTSISPPPGSTVRLTRRHKTGEGRPTRIQAEFTDFGAGVVVEAGPEGIGFAGNGYLKFPPGGGYAQWSKVGGLTRGRRTIKFRYANGGATPRMMRLLINGAAQNITFPTTGSWEKYSLLSVTAPLKRGATNTIRVESAGGGAGHIDELQIL